MDAVKGTETKTLVGRCSCGSVIAASVIGPGFGSVTDLRHDAADLLFRGYTVNLIRGPIKIEECRCPMAVPVSADYSNLKSEPNEELAGVRGSSND